jgi:hypothetical protein
LDIKDDNLKSPERRAHLHFNPVYRVIIVNEHSIVAKRMHVDDFARYNRHLHCSDIEKPALAKSDSRNLISR